MYKHDPIWRVYSESREMLKTAGFPVAPRAEQPGHVMATFEFDDSQESMQLARDIQDWLQSYKAYNDELMYREGEDYQARVTGEDGIMTKLEVLSGDLFHDSTFHKFMTKFMEMSKDDPSKSSEAGVTNQYAHSPTAQKYADLLPELAQTLMQDQETVDKIKYHAGGVNPRRSKQMPIKIYWLNADAVYDYEEVSPNTYRRNKNEIPFHDFYETMDHNSISEWERDEEFKFEDEYTGWLPEYSTMDPDEELTDLRLRTAMSMLEHLGMVVYHADFSGGEDVTYIMVNHSRSPYLGRRLALRDAYVKAWAGSYELQQLAGVGMLEEQYQDLIDIYDLGNKKSPFYVGSTPTQQLTDFEF